MQCGTLAQAPQRVAALLRTLERTVAALPGVRWTWQAEAAAGTGFVAEDVWSRAYRRRQQQQQQQRQREEEDGEDKDRSEPPTALTAALSLASLRYGRHAALGFRISVRFEQRFEVKSGDGGGGGGSGGGIQGGDDDDQVAVRVAVVSVRWLQGVDSVLFESFCGMLKRKIGGCTDATNAH